LLCEKWVGHGEDKRAVSNSFNAKSTLTVGSKDYTYYSLPEAAKTLGDISRLPYSLKVLLENMLRYEDGAPSQPRTSGRGRLVADQNVSSREIAYRPARVLMQDFTGVPAVVDLAAMRDAMVNLGGDPDKINPLSPVDLVIDHSVMVDSFGSADAFEQNVDRKNFSATMNATPFCAGAKAPLIISAWCPLVRAFATR
jgi:aconitate hydratase